jgi:hypothetical protein
MIKLIDRFIVFVPASRRAYVILSFWSTIHEGFFWGFHSLARPQILVTLFSQSIW